MPPPSVPPAENGAVCRAHYPRELKFNPSGRAEKCCRAQLARRAIFLRILFRVGRNASREGRCIIVGEMISSEPSKDND